MSFSHSCIKCKQKYDSEEPDAYYCAACNETRLKIAAEVDKKLVKPRRETKSLLQEYDEAPKVRGFMMTRL